MRVYALIKGKDKNESTYASQHWRIRQSWSAVHCNASPLRPVWLAQTECAGPRHRLSLLLPRSACTPESHLSPQGPRLSPGTDYPTPGGRSLFGPTASNVHTQTGASSAYDRHRAGAACTYIRPASP